MIDPRDEKRRAAARKVDDPVDDATVGSLGPSPAAPADLVAPPTPEEIAAVPAAPDAGPNVTASGPPVTPASVQPVTPASARPAAPASAPPAAPVSRRSQGARRPVVETASADVDLAAQSTRMPGASRGTYDRFPTAPVEIAGEFQLHGPGEDGPDEDAVGHSDDGDMPRTDVLLTDEPELFWAPPAPRPRPPIAGWALASAILALSISLFIGWGLPLAVIAVILAVMVLRREHESRAMAVWALVVALAAVVYSIGWLVYAASQLGLL